MTARVLVVDDDLEMRELLRTGLERRGFSVRVCASGDEALVALHDDRHDVLVADLKMRGMNGLELCERIVANHPMLPVIVITAFGSMDTAVSALRAGAFDFIAKPLELDALAIAIERGMQHRALREQVGLLRQEVLRAREFERLLGTSNAMRALRQMIERIAESPSSVLVTGETGTGKELVARTLHEQGPRADRPFVAVNCAAMPEQLLESELFGHARGAFTDARTEHTGLFVRADGGTLFLDEIAELSDRLQPKLLRALQERVVRPVGSGTEIPFDARIVAATNTDLEEAVQRKEFRADLYFRLNVIHVRVPPLRERQQDILMLAQHFLEEYATRAGKSIVGIGLEAAKRLRGYHWPGNVRELENCMEHAVALTRHEHITVDDLPERLRNYRSWNILPDSEPASLLPLQEVERRYIKHVLGVMAGNKRQTARVLGVDRATLYRKLARYQISSDDAGEDKD